MRFPLFSLFSLFLLLGLSGAPLFGAEKGFAVGSLLRCPDRTDCTWIWNGPLPRLDTTGGVEAELELREGTPEGIDRLEWVAVGDGGALGFDPLLLSETPRLQSVSSLPLWEEGEGVDPSRPPVRMELRWNGREGSGGAVRVVRWRWRSTDPEPDEIGKMGPFREMIGAVQELKEGAMPPYSGVRGERVEKARRIHMELWKAGRNKGPGNDLNRWKEGRRWMAQAWVLNGPTSVPPPGEQRGVWIQSEEATSPERIDSLRQFGGSLVLDEGWSTALDPSDSRAAETGQAAERGGLLWVPVFTWGLLPETTAPEQLRLFDSLGVLQQDPNGDSHPVLTLCSDEVIDAQIDRIREFLRKHKLRRVAVQSLELPFGPLSDYHPLCRTLWEQELLASPDSAERKELLKRWPAVVFPDSALDRPFRDFLNSRLDSAVRRLSRELKRDERELWIAADDTERDERGEAVERWPLWGEEGWIDRAVLRVYETDYGRFQIRTERLAGRIAEINASRRSCGLSPLAATPMITTWNPLTWQERQELPLQLEQIGAVRRHSIFSGWVLFTAHAAWLRHDAGWVARGILPGKQPANR